MKDFKSSASRLARVFKSSRDKWRALAARKQKKVRALEIRVRDLEASRENWKRRAQAAEQALKERGEPKPQASRGGASEGELAAPGGDSEGAGEVIEGELLKAESGPSAGQSEVRVLDGEPARAAGHRFGLWQVEVAVRLVAEKVISLRGGGGVLEVLGKVWGGSVASGSALMWWVYRLGLYALHQPVGYARDWIGMVDLSIELGPAKVLVIVGLRRAVLEARRAAARSGEATLVLSHHDVQILEMAVLWHSNREVIEQHLEALCQRVGPFVQLISDHGSDVKSGIEHYRRRHPETRYTYDVTHQAALWLKHELEPDVRFGQFLEHLHRSAQAVQQTPLAAFKPPARRAKGRWLQVGEQVRWAQQMVAYAAAGDFHLIATGYRWDAHSYLAVAGVLSPAQRQRLGPETWGETFPDQACYLQALSARLGADVVARHHATLSRAGDLGRRAFEAKFDWLYRFEDNIVEYAQLIEVTKVLQNQLKHQGLGPQALPRFEQALAERELGPRAQRLAEQARAYLRRETQGLAEGDLALATSDVLESLFGKYKHFSSRGPLHSPGKLLLTLPLATIQFTKAWIKNALETVSTADVKRWAEATFGLSALARRRAAFGSPKETQNQHEEIAVETS